jgi:hypothetical protein
MNIRVAVSALLFTVLTLTLVSLVHAVSPATVTWVRDDPGMNLTADALNSDTTEAGNITYLNLSGDIQTNRWAGYLGNISGGIVLQDSDGYDFFRWAWSPTGATGHVCAGVATAYNWSLLSNISSTYMDADTAWNFASGADQGVDTFTDTSSTCGDVGSVSMGDTKTAKTGPDNPGSDAFETCVVNDNNDHDENKTNFLFCVEIDPDQSGNAYNTGTVDYELLVPIESGTETYYFWMDL